MSESVKETKELVEAIGPLAAALITRLKDGFDVADVVALASDSDLRAKIQAAVAGASKIPTEARDLTTEEVVELIPVISQQIVTIIAAVKAQKAA